MKKIRYLHTQLDIPLKPYQAAAFRGGVIAAMEAPSDFFHQHKGKGVEAEVIYRYPRIQYKSISGKASLICLEEGADKVQQFFQEGDEVIKIKDREWKVQVSNIKVKRHLLQVWKEYFYYGLINWIPLNQERHQDYSQLSSNIDRQEYLEDLLKSQIKGFLTEMGFESEREIRLRIREVYPSKGVHYKNMYYDSFKVDFYCNVSLPDYIGIGKAASTGFGIIYSKKERTND